ncbi:MAG: tetratricopeptide repeat protein [Candidatus Acidiferrales bacterium]
MAQHISRKELKKDEVRETLAHGAEAVLSHQQLTLYILIAAVVVAIGVFGWRTYAQRQNVKASAAFDGAVKTFQAPVGTPPTPGEVSYSDQGQKFTFAAQQFSDVASKYPRTHFGQLASYYAALSDEKIGKDADAKKWLEGVTGSRDEEVAALAQFELASLDDRMGQGDESVKFYQQLIAKPTVLVPKPVAMLALAVHYSQKDPSEAAKLYQQIKSEFPDTPIAEQADQALSLLPNKS